ncbi:MAG: hypothetical protein RIS64_3530, partial [Bacteroidota bacterium]
MNIAQIEANLQALIKAFNKDSFIYDFLLAYGIPKASITRLQQGNLNLSKKAGEIAWTNKLFFKAAAPDENMHDLFLQIQKMPLKLEPRFRIVTDFETLAAFDSKTMDSLDIPIRELAQHFDFFLPWAGMEKAEIHTENPADVKAAGKMAKLFDEIKKDNPDNTPETVHQLNLFLSRLLFCFFAEDTGIFSKGLFSGAVFAHTQQDGSDLSAYLQRVFGVMSTPRTLLPTDLPVFLTDFPYVNGGLFKKEIPVPLFSRRSRQTLLECGELNWAAINPDIFGSMIQAVVSPEHRGSLGMHYTSVPNIMKVIQPLFLDELHAAFEAAKGSKTKLKALLYRLSRIKILDPACGSGNFLIIAYKELRQLEILIIKELQELSLSNIQLSNFYGIELDGFAHEIAMLSLWLAEHQMNQLFFEQLNHSKPALPLSESGRIVRGNATRLDWAAICPQVEGEEVFVLGNPPYVGSSLQSIEQKMDMAIAFVGIEGYKNLDYIACWFLKGARYIKNTASKYAFVSTNSICQGEQVALLWTYLFKLNLEIGFAYTSFKWKNNAKANAGVSVIIVGIRNESKGQKYLFINDIKSNASNINPYLSNGQNLIVEKRQTSLSLLKDMTSGVKAGDGGNLILNPDEKTQLLNEFPHISHLIKNYVGADDLMNGNKRYCLWISDKDIEIAYSIPSLKKRFEKCRELRLASRKAATQKKANAPHEFDENKFVDAEAIIIPQTGSERRNYLPIAFLNSNIIIANSARIIYNGEPYLFSILSSLMHILWVKAVAGRLKMDMQYSNTLCYNTFPFPVISLENKEILEMHVYEVIGEREKHSEKTLAQLYDPDLMPSGLRQAHQALDIAVERCYRSKPFENDEERLAYLFKLYEQMI